MYMFACLQRTEFPNTSQSPAALVVITCWHCWCHLEFVMKPAKNCMSVFNIFVDCLRPRKNVPINELLRMYAIQVFKYWVYRSCTSLKSILIYLFTSFVCPIGVHCINNVVSNYLCTMNSGLII